MFEFDLDDIDLTESTRALVFDRDGHECWLCGNTTAGISIAHQIHAAAWKHPFPAFQANGIVPKNFHLSHQDNLIPLCPTCHTAYDMTFPEWIIIPDIDTLNRYLEHEKIDYDNRLLVANTSKKMIPQRTLPIIDRNQILYHRLILSPSFLFKKWLPTKIWLGEPTAIILRTAWRGILDPTPTQEIHLNRRIYQRGIPGDLQNIVTDLLKSWARQAPRRLGGRI